MHSKLCYGKHTHRAWLNSLSSVVVLEGGGGGGGGGSGWM